MAPAVRVHDGSVLAVCHLLDSRIQHRIDQLGVRTRAKRPAGHQPIEAVDHGREIHLASRDLELGDVGQPFLVGGCSLEIPVDEVFWRWADFANV